MDELILFLGGKDKNIGKDKNFISKLNLLNNKDICTNNTNIINNEKMTLMYKNITTIGQGFPEYFIRITKLYLSNNKIQNLIGIEFFKNLTHLSLSFNNLEKVNELEKISNKDILISLSVKGNLFMKNPLSSVLIIKMFSKLKDLDDNKISEATFKLIEGKDYLFY